MMMSTNVVDVGTPPPEFQAWETAEVRFHGFADLPVQRGWGSRSPEFTCLGRRWSLKIKPGESRSSEKKGMIAVYLSNMSETGIKIKYTLNVRDSDGRESTSCTPYFVATHKFGPKGVEDHGIKNFAKRSRVLRSLVNGTLVIGIRMQLVTCYPISLAIGVDTAPTPPPLPSFININASYREGRRELDIMSLTGSEQRSECFGKDHAGNSCSHLTQGTSPTQGSALSDQSSSALVFDGLTSGSQQCSMCSKNPEAEGEQMKDCEGNCGDRFCQDCFETQSCRHCHRTTCDVCTVSYKCRRDTCNKIICMDCVRSRGDGGECDACGKAFCCYDCQYSACSRDLKQACPSCLEASDAAFRKGMEDLRKGMENLKRDIKIENIYV